MKPIPPAADPHYIASLIILYSPVSDWKAKIDAVPEDKRAAVRDILETYYRLRKRK